MVAIVFNQNADSDPFPLIFLEEKVKIFLKYFFYFWLHKI